MGAFVIRNVTGGAMKICCNPVVAPVVLFLLAFPGRGCGAGGVPPPVAHPRFAEKEHIPGTSDTGKLNDFLYRGTQPTEKGLKNLRKLGIDRIVDLRGEFPWTMEREPRHAAKLGMRMRLISIPGNGW